MNQKLTPNLPQQRSEAQRRAETYLRALRGKFGPAERQLVTRALAAARDQERLNAEAHPVTRVMESLFELLSEETTAAPVAMTPPIKRVTMLPETTEFPLHDWLRGILGGRIFAFAGVR
jgi:glutathione S-transferase